MALAKKRLDPGRDYSPVGSVVRNDDFVLVAEISSFAHARTSCC
jgi:hypothetical protein